MNEDLQLVEGVQDSLLGIGQLSNENEILGVLQRNGVQPTAAIQKAMREHAVKRTQAATAGGVLNRTQRLLLGKAGELSLDDQKSLVAGQLQFQDKEAYRRIQVTTSTELIKKATDETAGVTNFSRQALEKPNNMVIDAVGIAYGTQALGSTNPAAARYTSDGNVVPSAILNGDLVFYMDDKPFFMCRVSRFFSDPQSALQPTFKGEGMRIALPSPKLWAAEVNIQVQLKLADGVALSALQLHFVEVVFFGVMTNTRPTK